jgi:hypothetical protein
LLSKTILPPFARQRASDRHQAHAVVRLEDGQADAGQVERLRAFQFGQHGGGAGRPHPGARGRVAAPVMEAPLAGAVGLDHVDAGQALRQALHAAGDDALAFPARPASRSDMPSVPSPVT